MFYLYKNKDFLFRLKKRGKLENIAQKQKRENFFKYPRLISEQ